MTGTAASPHAACCECGTETECCAFCDETECASAICYGCLAVALGQATPQPHFHGG